MVGETVYLYGPSGAGKSSAGRLLAECLRLPLLDLDQEIERQAGKSIRDIFAQEGEAGFRIREKKALQEAARGMRQVVALGGGTLLDPENRELVGGNGRVVCLSASIPDLVERLAGEPDSRPLLSGDRGERLERLLAERRPHYASFPLQLDTSGKGLAEIAWELQVLLGVFRVEGMGSGYEVRVSAGGLAGIGEKLAAGAFRGPAALVSDENVAALYGEQVGAALQKSGFHPGWVTFSAGEEAKNLHTVAAIWQRFLELGLERGSTVIALGGGVTTDLAGFAAATYLRGVPWVALPTSLLGMVDASLGGKTGFDLPQGKNLVGAFYPPRLVLADPLTLQTLPAREFRSGMAEVIKAGIIADPALFCLCAQGWEAVQASLEEVIRRAMAVKVRLIQEDPYESGRRAVLNLGHTVGHALELASDYRLAHGEAVAVGMVVEARLAEALGMANLGLAEEIAAVLRQFSLPVSIPPGLDRQRIINGMQVDKKKHMGELRFALPVMIGAVKPGISISGTKLETLKKILEAGK